ncbi:hypothetical protein [Edwardsiella tarda]
MSRVTIDETCDVKEIRAETIKEISSRSSR